VSGAGWAGSRGFAGELILGRAGSEWWHVQVVWSLRAVGRERSQVSRMLKSLAATGLIEQDPETRAYRLGRPMYALTARAGDQQLLRRGSPVLRALALETGESVVLSVLRGMVAALNVSGSSERMCDRLATHSVAAQVRRSGSSGLRLRGCCLQFENMMF
jgi:hypothetical protein